MLALFILVAHGERTSIPEKCLLFGLTAFAAATHSATLAVLLGLCCIGWIARPFLRGRWPFDDLTLLAGTITSAVLGNAFICAVISGPHDRYGARMAWLATAVLLIAAIRHFTGDEARDRSLPA